MTHVATMGTGSCATIAISGFKEPNQQLNEDYKKDPKAFKVPSGMTVKAFYNEVLYPVSQPLGKTHDLPFTRLMEEIEASSLKTKFIIATINEYQYNGKENYWPKELNKHGFKLMAKTKNSIGSMNYVYVRSPLAEPIKAGEF